MKATIGIGGRLVDAYLKFVPSTDKSKLGVIEWTAELDALPFTPESIDLYLDGYPLQKAVPVEIPYQKDRDPSRWIIRQRIELS